MVKVFVEKEISFEELMLVDYFEFVKVFWVDFGVKIVIVKGNEYVFYDNLV